MGSYGFDFSSWVKSSSSMSFYETFLAEEEVSKKLSRLGEVWSLLTLLGLRIIGSNRSIEGVGLAYSI